MKKISITPTLFFLLLCISVFIAAPASAEDLWNGNNLLLGQPQTNTVSIEAVLPDYEESMYYDCSNQIYIASLYLNLKGGTYFLLELPYLMTEIEADSAYLGEYTISEDMFGNPYVGVNFVNDANNSAIELGIYLPIAPDNGTETIGLSTSLMGDFERFPLYVPDMKTIKATYKQQFEVAPEFFLGIQAGALIHLDADYLFRDDTELNFQYAGLAAYASETVSLRAVISGLMRITEGDMDLDERTIHSLGVSASFHVQNVTPGVYIKFPLDDLPSDAVEHTLGVYLSVYF